jgi:hypothetical protein
VSVITPSVSKIAARKPPGPVASVCSIGGASLSVRHGLPVLRTRIIRHMLTEDERRFNGAGGAPPVSSGAACYGVKFTLIDGSPGSPS